jgi:hypothetical protein
MEPSFIEWLAPESAAWLVYDTVRSAPQLLLVSQLLPIAHANSVWHLALRLHACSGA